jgi:hypothetical protein
MVVISFVMEGKVMLAKNSDHLLRLISSEKIRGSSFVGLAYQGKDIVFRFIIEYSSFYMRIFEISYFGLCWKLEISYRVMISPRILVSFGGFFEDYIFAW